MKPTLIVVEDVEDISRYTATLLKDNFEIVGIARNGEEAVEICKNFHPDIVLMDVVMPVMSGLEATKKIVSNNSNPPKIIILTGLSDEGLALKAIEAGATDYLTKPIEKDELVRILLSYVSQTLKDSA